MSRVQGSLPSGAWWRGAACAGVFVVVFGFVASAGCDIRPTLAQTGLFNDYRGELLAECCRCLALRGTDDVDATCTEARLVDGGIDIPDGAVFGDPTADGLDDLDDDLDPGEIPCLCNADEDACIQRLQADDKVDAGPAIVIPGACINQLTRTAPCEDACLGVLNFDPVPVAN